MSGIYWIASYPKSGNTWLRLALLSLWKDGAELDFASLDSFAPVAGDREAFEAVLGVESGELTDAEILALRPTQYREEARLSATPLLRKVHDAWTATPDGEPLFPPDATAGSIYIVRDPRDVAISLAHHFGRTVDQAIEQLNCPTEALARMPGGRQLAQRLLSWSGHVSSWIDDARPRPLLLRYEAMLGDPSGSLAAAAKQLGMSPDTATVARAALATRFDRLRAEEDRVGFRERPMAAARFFRRGLAGGWREELSPAQIAVIERAHGPMMTRLGYL